MTMSLSISVEDREGKKRTDSDGEMVARPVLRRIVGLATAAKRSTSIGFSSPRLVHSASFKEETTMTLEKGNKGIKANNYTSTVQNVSECIDLRSDTVTLPTAEMKQAMVDAVLGDDVYGEDPTINSLEKRCAELFNKEAALFVASGTMGNLIAVLVHCQRGDEIIVGRSNHIHRWEQGNYAQLGGVSATTLNVLPDGTMDISDIEDSIRCKDSHMPHSRLICLETTHNFSGGKVLSLEYLRSVRELADRYRLKIHIDGARIYNAAVALGITVAEIAQYADSVQMCFSKGLGAPIGSIIVGSQEFIDEARRKRKALGGGWRQAGILAAAAHVALDHAQETISKDHELALALASGINSRTPDHLKKTIHAVEKDISNLVLVHCGNGITPHMVRDFFHERRVLIMPFDATRLRVVLNHNVREKEIARVLEVYEEFVKTLPSQ